jgi:ABC-type Zn uptake system ZnuABC Zn-binding protein ZnuA
MKDTEEKTELINSLETEYGAKIVEVDTMTTLSTEKKDNNENYLTIMNNYLENIKNATLGE